MEHKPYRIVPAAADRPVICCIADPDGPGLDADGRVSLVIVKADWDHDLTPWPAQGAFRDQQFTGGAGDFLRRLTEEILPAAEDELGFVPTHRGILGYSLAGLFAMYALYESDRFDLAASVSGSLWYDGWIDYMAAHTPPRSARVHLSVGDREKKTRNPRMKTVEACTRRAAELLSQQGCETEFRLNPGNHFQEPALRQRWALDWLLQPFEG